jgi:hypothetical protein
LSREILKKTKKFSTKKRLAQSQPQTRPRQGVMPDGGDFFARF